MGVNVTNDIAQKSKVDDSADAPATDKVVQSGHLGSEKLSNELNFIK